MGTIINYGISSCRDKNAEIKSIFEQYHTFYSRRRGWINGWRFETLDVQHENQNFFI